MPGFILIERTDPGHLQQTLEALPGIGKVEIFDCDDEGTPIDDVFAATRLLVRIEGDVGFARFAMARQGYAKVCRAPWD